MFFPSLFPKETATIAENLKGKEGRTEKDWRVGEWKDTNNNGIYTLIYLSQGKEGNTLCLTC